MSQGPVVDDAYRKHVEAARAELKSKLAGQHGMALKFLRLALNDFLEYDKSTQTGGANGSIRSERELRHAANANLSSALAIVEELKGRSGPVTFADIIALGGVVAAAELGLAGVDFVPGRRDSRVAPPDGRLPYWAKAQEAGKTREILDRWGLPLDQGVALLGLHPYGPSWEDPTAAEESAPPARLTNAFFVQAAGGKAAPFLTQDPEVKAVVERFAASEEAFLAAARAALGAASVLGTPLPPPGAGRRGGGAGAAPSGGLAPSAAGGGHSAAGGESGYYSYFTYGAVAVAAVAVGLGAVYLMRRRRERRL